MQYVKNALRERQNTKDLHGSMPTKFVDEFCALSDLQRTILSTLRRYNRVDYDVQKQIVYRKLTPRSLNLPQSNRANIHRAVKSLEDLGWIKSDDNNRYIVELIKWYWLPSPATVKKDLNIDQPKPFGNNPYL